MGFADDIKALRHQCLLNQEEFAKEIGVSHSAVNRWERGLTKPNFNAMKRIDEFCKVRSIDFKISESLWRK